MVLDFRHKDYGSGISADEMDEALDKIGSEVKERDIVLIHTGASAYNHEERHIRDHCGMTEEATRLLISRGVRMIDGGCPKDLTARWVLVAEEVEAKSLESREIARAFARGTKDACERDRQMIEGACYEGVRKDLMDQESP